jgi:hypothetical protein
MTASRPFTLTVSPPPMACTPRPAVLTQPVAGGGKLQVTIRATALEGLTNNRLHEIRFGDPGNGVGNLQNARVTLTGQPHTSSFTYAVPPGTVEVTFTVERVTAGQPTTVFLAVVDGCGTWKTFVGGGTGAAF